MTRERRLMRPMLAATADEALIEKHLSETFLMGSPKLDGIRGIIKDGQLVSRTLKLIRNTYVQSILGRPKYEGLDGELICGDPTALDVYRKSNSAFMSEAGMPDFTYFVFDYHNRQPALPFTTRHSLVVSHFTNKYRFIEVLPHENLHSFAQVIEYEQSALKLGYEGIILRRPDAFYKFNRSTPKEGGMMKLKRFKDSEAVILSVEELMHNENPAEESELGLTKRSSHKEHKVPGNTMGYLVVKDIYTGVEFKIGTGFDAAERTDFWTHKNAAVERIVKYKFLEIGVKDKPRHPVYLGMRDKEDIS